MKEDLPSGLGIGVSRLNASWVSALPASAMVGAAEARPDRVPGCWDAFFKTRVFWVPRLTPGEDERCVCVC